MTKRVKASDLKSDMLLSVGFYGEFVRISRVRYTSAGTTTIVELDDGSTQYHRNHATMEVAS